MDERLTLIAQMVRPCTLAADIGTDHGFLICALVEAGTVAAGIAADINPMPLEKAKAEILRRGLAQRIETRCTDGLTGIAKADAVVIAGMGGELIAKIVDCWPESRSGKTTFYLQPMTKAERLRHYLYTHGFLIETERCCVANGKPYSVMRATYTGVKKEPDWPERYLGAIDAGAGEWEVAYCKKLAARLRRKLAGMDESAIMEDTKPWRLLLTEIERRLGYES